MASNAHRPGPTARLGLGPRAAFAATALVVLVTACAGGGPGASGGASPAAAGALRVVATTTVLADLVAQVGGPKVSVVSLVPKGGEVHTFDPSPSDVATIGGADLVVINGLGLDNWLGDLVADAGSSAEVVELGVDVAGVTYLGGDDGEEVNPHLWLNVAYAQAYVAKIAAALAAADPSDAAAYDARAAAFDARLATLDAEIRASTATIPAANRRLVSFHEAFPYFAAAYGLEIVGTIVDAPGQDPSAGELAALVDAIRASGVRAVVTEAQFSPDLAETVAAEADVAVVRDLYNDSLGDAPVDTYEGMMRWNAERTVEALR